MSDSPEGRPSARCLLLKGFTRAGFQFFTDYESRKARDLASNPYAALVFFWEPLHRSVRVQGSVEKVSVEESTEYFRSRPRESQISACASKQSSVIESRDVLTKKTDELRKLYADKEVPKPENWGGFLVKPEVVEFWQGQSTRAHDRIQFRRPKNGEVVDEKMTHTGDDGWVYERLSP
ncbi:pyridoxine-5'-phosphate oxidase-like [Saccoglossus kowalevskii]|uniref:pyridoxal 5'-phosphate synthase n=1 Tax=Saccoglossus kowalevskii TaxID=10224 RepID=A0ABM0GLN9_SACKO|nr:PREDICTED: pyridoxine-5'-phosphate oxidase-like [Saccoglossus kowalevskii]